MDYNQIVIHYKDSWDIRVAWFIQKHYLERKDANVVMQEMYLTTKSWYYKLRKRVHERIKEWNNSTKWKDCI